MKAFSTVGRFSSGFLSLSFISLFLYQKGKAAYTFKALALGEALCSKMSPLQQKTQNQWIILSFLMQMHYMEAKVDQPQPVLAIAH